MTRDRPARSSLPRVLHVAECFAGGVKRAMEARASAARDYEHHLLFSGFELPETDDDAAPWTSVAPLPTGHLRTVLAIRSAVRRLRPDVVHAHSSWAGFHTRLIGLTCPVVYEPHCFKFDDPAAPPWARWAFRAAERLVAPRTAAFGALTAHEARLVRGLSPTARVVRIANTPSIEPEGNAPEPAASEERRTRVVTIGRITPQKDPGFFARTVREIRRRDPELRPVWIGDGDAEQRRLLEAEGVEVTGWLGAEEIRSHLRGAVYLHTAAYEGMPLAILDAAAVDAPVAARAIPPVRELPVVLEATPQALAEAVCRLSRPGPRQEAALRGNAWIRRTYSPERLGDGLAELYRVAL